MTTTLLRRRKETLRTIESARDILSRSERELADIERRIALAAEIARKRTAHRPKRKSPALLDAHRDMRAEGWA